MKAFSTCKFVSALAIAGALLAGCSKKEEAPLPWQKTERSASIDAPAAEEATPSARMVPPGISPHAAPGVAFNYRYAFVLPSAKISGVQEQHAAACEKLGVTQCRITGMRYSLIDEDEVAASLEFKLSPELARNFGKEGISAVEKAEGRLVDAAIEGNDVGTQITQSQRRSGDLQALLTRIEQRLAAGSLGDDERAELQAQTSNLRAQLASERQTRTEGEEQLANTPMSFSYTSDQNYTLGSHPFQDAGESSWDSLMTMISVVLMAVGVALPWLLLAGLALAVWRSPPGLWLRTRVRGKPREAADAAPKPQT